MNKNLKISLTTANNEPVSLRSLTPEALDSFLTVVSSLKIIATSISSSTDLNFVIQEGSAAFAIAAPDSDLEAMYDEMNTAIRGESEDKQITSNLRVIQDQIKREGFIYSFDYNKSRNTSIAIHTSLKEAKRISLKRRRRDYLYKVRIMSGFLNLIGGKNPNYHFDYGDGVRLTIDCTQEQAMEVNKFLYQNIDVLVLSKEWTADDKKDEYYHRALMKSETVKIVKPFLKIYYKADNLLDRLRAIHDFVDDCFKNTKYGHEILAYLLIAFNDVNLHLSELKTLLVISKPFKEHKLIKKERESLLGTYTKKRGG